MVFGLYYYLESRLVCLPLLNVCAEASIKELAAQVKLTQTYNNEISFPIDAVYAFPIPARAAVSSFVLIKHDGTRVVGRVQEEEGARRTYDTAVARGQQASLMEQQTPDLFQVSVGNIPAREQVKVELVYATELSEDEENDSVRFHLPVHIGARYGRAPVTLSPRNPFAPSYGTPFLRLSMSVESTAPISKISCPSHIVSTELGPDPSLSNFKELPFSNYARVSLSSDSPLDKDFVLTVKSAGLDSPRCIAELHPTNDTVAMSLTLVPRFKLPDVSRQEFVFMVDRSASMIGRRIEAAKKALIVMLRALPHRDSLFQIVSFGTGARSLWPHGSKPYNQETLQEATRHVDSMRADFGGTEMRTALRHCFGARKLDRPMSLLVLTDGDAWDLDDVFAEVKSAVAEAPEKAYLRVSVLGIGNSASTAMCEGMARIGNGTSMMVGEEETSFTGKIARMLKAAKTPLISNINIDWGLPASHGTEKQPGAAQEYVDEFEIVEKASEKKTLNIFDETKQDFIEADSTPVPPPPSVVLAPPPPVQQAPFKIKNLFPNIRLNVYAILQSKTIPKTVTIRGSTVDGAEIELPITVALSHLQNAPGAPPAIHALAARKLIQDLEDGRHELVKTLANPDDTDLLQRTVKASIVRLGKNYSIASTYMSFVAVDEMKPYLPAVTQVSIVPKQRSLVAVDYSMAYLSEFVRSPSALGVPPPPPASRQPASQPARGGTVPDVSLISLAGYTYSAISSLFSPKLRTAAASSSLSDGSATVYMHSASTSSPRRARPAARRARPAAKSSMMTEMVADSYVDETLDQSDADDGDSGLDPVETLARLQSFDGRFDDKTRRLNPLLIDPVETLARLQSFDGCFSTEVLTFVSLKTGLRALRALFPTGAAHEVVATVLAMAFLSTKLGADVERDSWEGMYEKAREYVEEALAGVGVNNSVEVLEAQVAEMLA